MKWILYLLIGILVAYLHFKLLDVRTPWEFVLIAMFWPVVLVLLVLDALIVFI